MNSLRRTILFIASSVPYPLDSGTRIRTYRLLEALAASFDIILVTLAHSELHIESAEALRPMCKELHVVDARRSVVTKCIQLFRSFIRGVPYIVEANTSERARIVIADCLLRGGVDVVQVQELIPAANLPVNLGSTPLVLDAHNVEARVAERIAATASNPLVKLFYRLQVGLIRVFEETVAQRASAVLAVSPEDAEYFSRLSERTVFVPNGSTPPLPRTEPPVSDSILFTGTLEYPPNAEGLLFFLERVFPLIRRERPNATLTVVARKPSMRHRRFEDSAVRFITDAEDSAPYFYSASVLVAPLFAGGGTRLKLLQAFASYLPAVSTTLGAEGLDVAHREHLLVADTAATFAESVVKILSDRQFGQQLAESAAELVREKYLWSEVSRSVGRCYEEICR